MGLFKWPLLCVSSLPRSLRAHGGPFSLSVSARARVALSWGTGVGTSAGSAGLKFPDLQHQRVQYGRAFSIHIFFLPPGILWSVAQFSGCVTLGYVEGFGRGPGMLLKRLILPFKLPVNQLITLFNVFF